MHITVNGERKEITDRITVAELLTHYALDPRRVAVEVNVNIIKRDRYGSTALSPGDVVEIVHMVGGGAW